MLSLVRFTRPCMRRLKSLSTQKFVHSTFRQSVKILPRQNNRWGITTLGRFYSTGTEDKDNAKEIAELKEMFKDDPQLETWLKELEANNSVTVKTVSSEDVTSFSTATELDREMLRYNIEEFYSTDADNQYVREVVTDEEPLPISTERGLEGVFDIEELVDLLHVEGLKDICVIRVPESFAYADYLVLSTGRNLRQIKAAAHYINWFFKQKRESRDPPTCTIEGLQSTDWLAMDMGNIVLHLMLKDTREMYDIETLWTVGAEFDDKLTEEKDPFADFDPFPQDNLLTLSKEVEYAFEDKGDRFVEEKYMDEKQDMESVTEWHKFKKK